MPQHAMDKNRTNYSRDKTWKFMRYMAKEKAALDQVADPNTLWEGGITSLFLGTKSFLIIGLIIISLHHCQRE